MMIMENGYIRYSGGKALTHIHLPNRIDQHKLDLIICEIDEYLTVEQYELFSDNLISIHADNTYDDGDGSVVMEWKTDHNGDIDPDLAKMLEELDDPNSDIWFWYSLPTVEEILLAPYIPE